MNRKNILIDLVKAFNFKSYLELGLRDRETTFNHIPCKIKTSVDINPVCKPDFCGKTDDFFKVLNGFDKYDLIFIDACHKAESVYKDLMSSVKYLSEGGVIVLHDTLPIKFENTANKLDNGTAWKVVPYVLKNHPELHICTIPETKCGCSVVIKNYSLKREVLFQEFNLFLDYDTMDENRVKSQNLISYNHLFDWINKPFYQF